MIMTKSILPWQAKPGMRHPFTDVDGTRRVGIVASVHRGKSTFAGGNITIIQFENDSVPLVLHHRKPVSRFYIEVL